MPDSDQGSPVKSSPLTGLPAAHGGITIEERPFAGKVNLRGDPGDSGFVSGVAGALGCNLPVEPNCAAASGEHTVFWLGPDEWQIHCPEHTRHALITSLRDALGNRHAAVVDVSDYYVVVRLSGEKVLEVLAKGTPLDLHPRAFPAGRCAQTRFGHATVLLHKVNDNVVDLQVRWSFAEHVWSFIVAGTREYLAPRE